MRPTPAHLSNSLGGMPEGWDAPPCSPVAELPPAHPLSWRNSPRDQVAPQAVRPRRAV